MAGGFGPRWWHSHGIKMELKQAEYHRKYIRLQASAASLEIRGSGRTTTEGYKRTWTLDWEVVQSYPDDIKAQGRTCMDDAGLKRAFGLDDSVDPYGGAWLVKDYGATTARQGCFIRRENYLNIPCPGTGHDGDPNLSMEVTDEIKEAVRRLLGG